jgi:hypothetical protein
MAAFIGIGGKPRYFKKYDPMIELVVAEKCHAGKRRPVRHSGPGRSNDG